MTRSATTLASVVSSPPPPPPHRTSPRSRALHSASLFFLLVASFLVAAPSLLLHPVSAEASLLSLQSSVSSPLSPSFTPSTADRAFTQYVPQPTQEMNFTVVAQGADQVRARWNGGQRFDLVSGVSTPKLALSQYHSDTGLLAMLLLESKADIVVCLVLQISPPPSTSS
jgi:hypothetical protein